MKRLASAAASSSIHRVATYQMPRENCCNRSLRRQPESGKCLHPDNSRPDSSRTARFCSNSSLSSGNQVATIPDQHRSRIEHFFATPQRQTADRTHFVHIQACQAGNIAPPCTAAQVRKSSEHAYRVHLLTDDFGRHP